MPNDELHAEYWLAVAAAAPVLLVAFATTYVDLLEQSNKASERRGRLNKAWTASWIMATPIIGGLLTLGAVVVLALRQGDPTERAFATVFLGALALGLVSTGITLYGIRAATTQEPDHPEGGTAGAS